MPRGVRMRRDLRSERESFAPERIVHAPHPPGHRGPGPGSPCLEPPPSNRWPRRRSRRATALVATDWIRVRTLQCAQPADHGLSTRSFVAPASCWQAPVASQAPIKPCRLPSWRQHLAGRRRSPHGLRSNPAGCPRGASILLAGAGRLTDSDRPLPAALVAPASCWQVPVASQTPIESCRLPSWRQHLAGRCRSPHKLRSNPAGWKPAPRGGPCSLVAPASCWQAPVASQTPIEPLPAALVAPASCWQAPVAAQAPIEPCRLEASATREAHAPHRHGTVTGAIRSRN